MNVTTHSVRLGDVADVQLGKMLSPAAQSGDLAPYLRNANIQWGTIELDDLATMAFDEAERLKFALRKGDLLVCEGGEPGRCAVIDKELEGIYFQKALMRVRVNAEKLNVRYLQHYMQYAAAKGLFKKDGNQATIAHFPAVRLNGMLVPLPLLGQQERIAAILDRADTIRRKRKQAIALTEQLLRSTFLEMFGDPVTNPKAWPTATLGSVADVNRGKFSPRPRNDPRFYGGNFPFIQTGDIRRATGYLREWTQTLNEDGIEVSRGFGRGAIAISIAANIGDTAIVDYDFYCPDSVVCIEATSNTVTPEYLEMVLRFYKPFLLALAPETAQKNINLETLRPLAIPEPTVSLATFSALYRRVYQLQKTLTQQAATDEQLFNALVSQAFAH